MRHLYQIGVVLLLGILSGQLKAEDLESYGCSQHAFTVCHPNAICTDIDETNFTCTCKEGYEGDGLLAGQGCGPKLCTQDSDCHTNAFCNDEKMCECNKGYEGEPNLLCTDIDECLMNLCHQNATCNNTEGSFVCRCRTDLHFYGNGTHCSHSCENDNHCETRTEVCDIPTGLCKCKPGFIDTPQNCQNINECEDGTHDCSEYAECTDTPGGYVCTCFNGYKGDGKSCEKLPINCHEVRIMFPKASSGRYTIDPDGTDVLGPINVYCELRVDFGITKLKILNPNNWIKGNTKDITYRYEQTLEEIKAVIESSQYCFQKQSNKCYKGAPFMDAFNDWWEDGNGDIQYNWGGSTETNNCLCGQFDVCDTASSNCNCDGTTLTKQDEGKVTNKTLLPIQHVHSEPGVGRSLVKLGDIFCANRTFDIPLDCNDAKWNYRINKDGVVLVDFDGPDGGLEPYPVLCDMETYKHVGVTVIKVKGSSSFSGQGTHQLKYTSSDEHIMALIENSKFCSQDSQYDCKNSQFLFRDGEWKGYVTDLRDQRLEHGPGGMGISGSCGCGVLSVCANEADKCNCDLKDGQNRTDRGKETNKDFLPFAKVTLNDVGAGSTGKFSVGALMCSQREFGIPGTCQNLVEDDETAVSDVYLIDPDGAINYDNPKDNQPPFPVYCEVKEGPRYGVTIVYHSERTEFAISGRLELFYLWANSIQLKALTDRSTTCVQRVEYSCKSAPIHNPDNGEALLEFYSQSNDALAYLQGEVEQNPSCACGLDVPNSCADDSFNCNCDIADNTNRTDNWMFKNKDHLPVAVTDYNNQGNGEGNLLVGPLECRELNPSCADLVTHKSNYKLVHEQKMQDGEYVIEPLPNKPFTVICTGTLTTVPTDIDDGDPTGGKPDEGVSKCYNVQYKSADRVSEVTTEQVQALVSVSRFCSQTANHQCVNAPATEMTSFSTCGGDPQTGWFGSDGADMCKCGVVGDCDGGTDAKCNCDVVDGDKRKDGGTVVNTTQLAICKFVFLIWFPFKFHGPTSDHHFCFLITTFFNLFCDRLRTGSTKSCQEWRRRGRTKSQAESVHIVSGGVDDVATVICRYSVEPPFGELVIKPKNSTIPIPPDGGTVVIEYLINKFDIIPKLIDQSYFCTQELYIECNNATFDIAVDGWYSRDGVLEKYWPGGDIELGGCKDGVCKCNLGGNQEDGGIIIESWKLPVQKVKFGSSDGTRTVKVGPVVWKIKTIPPNNKNVKNNTEPGSYTVTQEYVGATPEQIHGLQKTSDFCLQRIDLTCKNTPIYGSNVNAPKSYYETYSGVSQSWGTAGFTNVKGCACHVLDTCKQDDLNCNCDSEGSMNADFGFVTEDLPITLLAFGGQGDDSYAIYDVSDVRCAPKPFDLPIDCNDAFKRGEKRSGTYMIRPSTNVPPFLVHCDMEYLPSGGVAVIKTDVEEGTTIEYGGNVNVTYYGPTFEQIVELVRVSSHCYQPAKYECTQTKMVVDGGYYSMYGGKNQAVERDYFGFGRDHIGGECTCGRENRCGGSEPKNIHYNLKRACNCDAADNESRADAGTFTKKDHLPVQRMHFDNPGTPNPSGILSVGPVMCGQEPFDIDECKLGFHDCHEQARCINLDNTQNNVGFKCECKKGWEGIGREGWANGRNCLNDNECAEGMNSCPLYADCIDTDGSFNCECQEGFVPKGSAKRKCIDIDECALNIHNCDVNADCINRPGTFDCRCKKNFRWNGTNCTAMGECSVFGDPHFATIDGYWGSYQGLCEYVLSRDNCGGGTPTFQLTAKFYQKYKTSFDASWIKWIALTINGDKIEVLPGNEVRVNGLTVIPTFLTPELQIISYGDLIEIKSLSHGIEVVYDIDGAVTILVPGNYAGKTCGICGNYNNDPNDDPTVGPACITEGNVTGNVAEFVESWVNPEAEDCSANCSAEVTDPCEGEMKAMAEVQCNRIYGKHKHFKECLDAMDDTLRENYHSRCIYDMCRIEGDLEQAICAHARHLVAVCSAAVDVEVKTFRTKQFCWIECGETKDYNPCVRGPPRTCADYLRNVTAPSTLNTECREGCICKPGYVLDDQECVEPEDCGCIYNDDYYQKGEVITTDNCQRVVTCEGDNMLSNVDDIECHEHATCTIYEGKYGCHCKEGYYGNGTVCVENPCLPTSPCRENETCVNNMNAVGYYQCECNPGYVTDCGICKELDECETELNTCPVRSDCVNTDGSFECKCKRGYVMSGGKCDDLNECDIAKVRGIELCTNNSVCVNRIGTYECKCCDGYEKNADNVCIPMGAATGGEKCCVCVGGRCNDPRKVCGTDHVNYPNYAAMVIAICQNNLRGVTVNYYGKCKSRCPGEGQPKLCPEYQTCNDEEGTAKPKCECEECTESDITSGSVCSSTFVIYTNLCRFKEIACKMDSEPEIIINMDYCVDRNGGIPVSLWTDWSPCSVSCGKGTMTRTRTGHVSQDFIHKYPLSAEAACYEGPCPGDPCDGEVYESCKNRSAECVVDENGLAKCECPTCKDIELDEVCGYLIKEGEDPKPETYMSACHLQKKACNQRRDHVVYNHGPCDVEPVECAMVPDVRHAFDDEKEYKSELKIDYGACSGECDEGIDYCCEPHLVKKTVVLRKIGNSTVPAIELDVDVVESCSCKELIGG
ncbi:uncharacterized protein LOC132718978 [Ruditapes philippinarum]|uniref:uncharacterized protein LOC132718978 n=1 Tax=Ruditapes philippinarum TaxID=129788 RepID=UPI00295A71A6|nr:uncharacterized protein LOC132718978 [Ruditapes philippinarum]